MGTVVVEEDGNFWVKGKSKWDQFSPECKFLSRGKDLYHIEAWLGMKLEYQVAKQYPPGYDPCADNRSE